MDENVSAHSLSGEDKILAGLSHLGVMVWMFGMIMGLLVWFNQRDRSHYSAFQGLQAAVYQMFIMVAYFLSMFLAMGCMFLGVFASIALEPRLMAFTMPMMVVVPMLLMFLAMAYGVVGAVMCFMGKDFRYVFIGRFLEGYLYKRVEPAPPVEEKDTQEGTGIDS